MTMQNQQHSAWSDSPANEYYRDNNEYDTGRQEYTRIGDQESRYLYDEPSNTPAFGQYLTDPDTAADYYDNSYAPENHEESGFYESSRYGTPENTGQFQVDGIQVYYDDLDDVRHHAPSSQMPKIIAVAACSLLCLGLLGAIISSSQPEMSAREIVQLESYKGSQKPQSIFNLADLNGCTSISECIKESRATSRAEIAKITQQTLSVREIPAAARAPNEVKNTQPIPINSHIGKSKTIDTEESLRVVDTLPPRLLVQKQWSIIRTIPDMTGGVITSLAKGTTVEIIGSSGEWYEIKAINQAAPRGYMHKSTVE